MKVSIVIPVLNRLAFTRQCLDRIWRNTSATISYEVIVVDNTSTDGTPEWFAANVGPTLDSNVGPAFRSGGETVDSNVGPTFRSGGGRQGSRPVRYLRQSTNLGFASANNIGARAARGEYLLFLNNDTLVQPGWLSAMLHLAESNRLVGIVGIKQLFPYTNIVYHTGVVFAQGGVPQHLYPHLDASLPQVNHEREYQAVNGACLLIPRSLFEECGGFDEAYVNGYEDTDLCMRVRQRSRTVVCCTSGFIYHYGQISEGRTAADDNNAALFGRRWHNTVRVDRDEYLLKDRLADPRPSPPAPANVRSLGQDCIYLADDLGHASAFTWVNVELAMALSALGAPIFVNGRNVSPSVPPGARKHLSRLALPQAPVGGVQMKFAHYWPRHLDLELNGDVNLEMFVTNYLFGRPGSEPWDYWMQSLRQNHRIKLPVSEFCQSVLEQVGVSGADCRVVHHGYSGEIHEVEPPARRRSTFRFLTVTNSHDLERYGTIAALEAYERAFTNGEDVALVVKDYGASSRDATLREWIRQRTGRAPIEYIADFTDKRNLIRLYKSCDAFISTHRGEGFGMKILDAMACGLPVITPLFGGPTAYCTQENCFPIEYSMIPVDDGVDARSLKITNQPIWADPNSTSTVEQLRRVYNGREAAAAIGATARSSVLERFSWNTIARRLVHISEEVRAARPRVARGRVDVLAPAVEHSPYWLGVRVSVVVPTHNRKEKLLACLDALTRQSILPQELEVLVVDDGSTDGTKGALESRSFPFALRYFRQEHAGPGAARNLGIEKATGELVLFVGDDIIADERLLEEHLLVQAISADPGTAVLGHIDWADTAPRNAVMEYVGGDATQQFAYSLVPRLSRLDHRFFYTSNICLKRQFLVDAANAGVRFDPCFRRAAFEDSEFALRLMPRGLHIKYAAGARAAHDHDMDLDGFARREFGAGEMAVVFYRKHPGQDDQLQVRWIADLIEPATALLAQPDFLRHLEAFDEQTDTLLRTIAGSLEELMGTVQDVQFRASLNDILRVIFDVERTRGKLQEWFSMVDDPARVKAAQTLASVMRKIEFLNLNAGDFGLPSHARPEGRAYDPIAPIDTLAVESLSRKIEELDGVMSTPAGRRLRRKPVGQAIRRAVARSSLLPRLLTADRYVQERLEARSNPGWLVSYRRVRNRIRDLLL